MSLILKRKLVNHREPLKEAIRLFGQSLSAFAVSHVVGWLLRFAINYDIKLYCVVTNILILALKLQTPIFEKKMTKLNTCTLLCFAVHYNCSFDKLV